MKPRRSEIWDHTHTHTHAHTHTKKHELMPHQSIHRGRGPKWDALGFKGEPRDPVRSQER